MIDRACACVEAGADAIFAEAMTDITMYKTVCDAVGVPVLANITEFGDTPYYTKEQLAEQGISMVLYPLSPTRAMQRQHWKSCMPSVTTEPKLMCSTKCNSAKNSTNFWIITPLKTH